MLILPCSLFHVQPVDSHLLAKNLKPIYKDKKIIKVVPNVTLISIPYIFLLSILLSLIDCEVKDCFA